MSISPKQELDPSTAWELTRVPFFGFKGAYEGNLCPSKKGVRDSSESERI